MGSTGVVSLFLVNANGQLVYQQDFREPPGDDCRKSEAAPGSVEPEKPETLSPLSANEKIRLASTLHACSELAADLDLGAPPPAHLGFQPYGLTQIQGNGFSLYFLESLTRLKIFLICRGPRLEVGDKLKKVYALYASYTLANPFQDPDMPIRSELFAAHLNRVFTSR